MSLVMSRRWLKRRDMFIAFSCIYTRVLNQFRNKSSNTEYSTVDQVGREKCLARKQFRVELIVSSFLIQSPSKLDLTLLRASCLNEVWRSRRFNTPNGLLPEYVSTVSILSGQMLMVTSFLDTADNSPVDSKSWIYHPFSGSTKLSPKCYRDFADRLPSD